MHVHEAWTSMVESRNPTRHAQGEAPPLRVQSATSTSTMEPTYSTPMMACHARKGAI